MVMFVCIVLQHGVGREVQLFQCSPADEWDVLAHSIVAFAGTGGHDTSEPCG